MRLTAVSPFGEEIGDEVGTVVVDTTAGRRVVLPGHGDFIGMIELGEVTALLDGDARTWWVAYGYVHVHDGDVAVIAQIISEDHEHVVRTHARLEAARESGPSRFAGVTGRG